MLSEEYPALTRRPGRVEAPAELVGATSLVRLRHSGQNRVWVKLESLGLAGSFFDRVAASQLARLSSDTTRVIIRGASNFAVSAVMLSRREELTVEVYIARNESQRLVQLLLRAGARLVRHADTAAADAAFEARVAAGDVALTREDPVGHSCAWKQLADEVRAQSDLPFERVVAADVGLPAPVIGGILQSVWGHAVTVELVADDREQERQLPGSLASRRVQTGHREGILLSPMGAEVIDLAIETAMSGTDHVLAVLPDAGHRYLGWW